MKSSVLAVATMLVASNALSQGELATSAESPQKSRTVNLTLDPIPAIIGMPGLGVNFYASNRVSLGINANYLVTDSVLKDAIRPQLKSVDNYDQPMWLD